MEKKVLGIIGGMGPLAGAVFQKRIVEKTAAKNDDEHIETLHHVNTKIPNRTDAIENGTFDRDILPELKRSVKILETAGAGVIAIPCNTASFGMTELQDAASVPIINIVDETARAVHEFQPAFRETFGASISNVGIYATEGTLKSQLYTRAFAKYGIKTVAPTPDRQRKISRLISEIKGGDKSSLLSLVARGTDAFDTDVDCRALCCTELTFVRKMARQSPNICFDSVDCLVRAAIEKCGYQYAGVSK
jgi:aspartate racemase